MTPHGAGDQLAVRSGRLDLTLPYLGNRDYLHSSTILDALFDAIGPVQNLKFTVNRLIEGNSITVVRDDQPGSLRADDRFRATLSGTLPNGIPLHLTLLETGKSKPRRIADDLQRYHAGARVVGDSVFQDDAPAGRGMLRSIIECNKILINSTVLDHPWLLARLQLKEYPVVPGPLRIDVQRSSSTRLVRSAIVVRRQPIGTVDFVMRS